MADKQEPKRPGAKAKPDAKSPPEKALVQCSCKGRGCSICRGSGSVWKIRRK